jgi:deazaflavin-dependent oxidoreductase (nitroreductase family)
MRKTLNKIANAVMKPLLRSPLHFFASGGIMLITFTGRKSGKVYTTPVQYQQNDDTVTFFTLRERVWWKNLIDGAPVTLTLKGQPVEGVATPYPDQDPDALRHDLQKLYPRMKDTQAADFAAKMLRVEVQLSRP